MENKTKCRIPVKATYRIIDGEPVMISAEYADIPADVIARLLLPRFDVAHDKGGRAIDN